MTTAAPPAETAARLDVRQMAQFVMDGFIEFDDLVPEDLNAAVHEEQLRAPRDATWDPKIPDAFLDTSPASQAVLELPRVKAILATLLGPSYIHDCSSCTSRRQTSEARRPGTSTTTATAGG